MPQIKYQASFPFQNNKKALEKVAVKNLLKKIMQ